MQQTRSLLLVAVATVALFSAGCPDRRPVWSIAPEAIEALDIDSEVETSRQLPTEWPEPGCQQILELGSDGAFPHTDLGPEGLKSWLEGVEQVDLACVGIGPDDSACLPHHNVKLVDAESAWTRCAATPQDEPPCALAVEWNIGKRTRRKIVRIYCATTEPPVSGCGFLYVPTLRGLQMTCSMQEN